MVAKLLSISLPHFIVPIREVFFTLSEYVETFSPVPPSDISLPLVIFTGYG